MCANWFLGSNSPIRRNLSAVLLHSPTLCRSTERTPLWRHRGARGRAATDASKLEPSTVADTGRSGLRSASPRRCRWREEDSDRQQLKRRMNRNVEANSIRRHRNDDDRGCDRLAGRVRPAESRVRPGHEVPLRQQARNCPSPTPRSRGKIGETYKDSTPASRCR